mgnify:CR=1 FL=1
MKKRFLGLITLAFLTFGGYIGYITNYTETVTANELVVPRLVDIPRNNGFNLNIDLNNGIISCNDAPSHNIDVKVIKKDSIVYKYRTLICNKEVPKLFVVRETKPFKGKPISCSDVLPEIEVEKINLPRD